MFLLFIGTAKELAKDADQGVLGMKMQLLNDLQSSVRLHFKFILLAK